MDLHDIRRDYEQARLSREHLAADPIEQFDRWLTAATAANVLSDPTAMTIATVNAQGQPRQRTVLLKHIDANGLVFFTNLKSAKGEQLAGNQHIAAHFSWLALEQQISFEGQASLLDRTAVAQYFHSRPRQSQLAAWASQQSQPIDSRAELERIYNELEVQYQDQEIPVPEHWGGYCIQPERVEFWQGGRYRLHDRFEYRRQSAAGNQSQQWVIQRLQP